MLHRWMCTTAQRSVVLIRLMVGCVFVSDGVQKFLLPALGPGRCADVGFPAHAAVAYSVTCVDAIAGLRVRAGRLTRPAALALAIHMAVAIAVTKVPILLGHGYGPFGAGELSRYGSWAMAHATRTDFAMLLGALFLLIVGAGPPSLGARLGRKVVWSA